MAKKKIVLCLDGTNNKVRNRTNSNVLRLYKALDHKVPDQQVAYYQPGVGTMSSPAAWTPIARVTSRVLGLVFGFGMRENLGDAYRFLMSVYQPGDQIYIIGFSRGAYTGRALSGMLEVIGVFRPAASNLVPYAVSVFTRHDPWWNRVGRKGREPDEGDRNEDKGGWKELREYTQSFSWRVPRPSGHGTMVDHVPVEFVGLWDTVNAGRNLRGQVRWRYTRYVPTAKIVRHAIAIDERRRPYVLKHVQPVPHFPHRPPVHQDRSEVWFAGVHTDVGGMFKDESGVSDIPLKWMAVEAKRAGVMFDAKRYEAICDLATADKATAKLHVMSKVWLPLTGFRRKMLPGAHVHASVQRRPSDYRDKLPDEVEFVDPDWLTSR